MIKDNLEKLWASLPEFNPYGEKITVVGATKTRTPEEINEAIDLGLSDVGENRAQEFRDKFDLLKPCNYHFFGTLQKNKVKYLVGKACLIQSVASVEVAEEISRLSVLKNVRSDILLELNQGESRKSGFSYDEILRAFREISALPSVNVKGIMTVLPLFADTDEKRAEICLQTRKLYDILKRESEGVSVLSMGMSEDYPVAVRCGSNMIRIGRLIFGERNHEVK